MTRGTHRMRVFSYAGLLVCLYGALSRADGPCAQSIKDTTFDCVYKTCESSVTVGMPQGSGSGSVHYSCTYQICCGQHFTDCFDDGGDCFFIRVRNPEVRKRLDQIADTSRVLVADCRGQYAPYEPRPDTGSVRDSVLLLNDHILR